MPTRSHPDHWRRLQRIHRQKANPNEDLFFSPTGPHGNAKRSNNGNKLREFMHQHGLCSTATFFEKQNHDTWSFNGQSEKTFRINHILAPRQHLKRFQNCDTLPGVESDHLMLAAVMRIASFIPRKSARTTTKNTNNCGEEEEKKKKQNNIDWDKLCKEKTGKFNDKLKIILQNSQRHEIREWCPQQECPYETLTTAIQSAAAEVAPADTTTKRPPWFELSQTELLTAIKKQDEATVTLKNDNSPQTRELLTLAQRDLNKTKTDARNKWLGIKLAEIEKLDNNPRDAWKSFKEINAGFTGHHKQAINIKMRKPDGSLAKTDAENAKVMFTHFEKVTNRQELSSYDPEVLDDIPPHPTQTEMDI